MTKQQRLDQLNQEWKHKELSLRSVATNDVPGEGNPDAEVLFVGEGPGKDEDEQGRPFVGAAGKFLTELIESVGWTRGDVFIANLIKHRPPGNRDPLPEEIAEYTPWLDEQIKIIQPKLIATLGRYSMAYYLGDGLSITKVHGQPKRNKAGLVVMPMYHPAAALYRGDLRPVLKEDFMKIKKVLELIDRDEPVTSEEEKAKEEEQEAEEEQAQATLF